LPLSLSRPLNKNVLYVGIFINFISALLLSLSSQPKRVLRLDKFHQLHEAFSSAGILRQVGIILYQFVINPSPCVILSPLAHSAIVYGNEITLENPGKSVSRRPRRESKQISRDWSFAKTVRLSQYR
jgi:hypothetical protein